MLIHFRLLALLVFVAPVAWAKTDIIQSSPPAEQPEQTITIASDIAVEPNGNATAPAADQALSSINVMHTSVSKKIPESQCGNSTEEHLQKTLLVTAFPRLNPLSSNGGNLYDAEQEIPQLLSQQLFDSNAVLRPIQLPETLPLPEASNDAQLAMQIQRLARNQRTQLVLSGEIIDMGMPHPNNTYNPTLYQRALNTTFDVIDLKKNRFDKRDRSFIFQVHLRDGFTGQDLLNKRYSTSGKWKDDDDIKFGSPLFWKSDYAQQINRLVKKAAKEIGDVIQCQPFIAQVESRPGQTQIVLQGGANNGLHTGDTLTLYQLVVQGSETHYAQHDVRLVNRNLAIELREVYPSHSVGIISGTPYLAGQFLAVGQ